MSIYMRPYRLGVLTPFPLQNPDTRPGVWPGLTPIPGANPFPVSLVDDGGQPPMFGLPIVKSPGPGQVSILPLVVPTSDGTNPITQPGATPPTPTVIVTPTSGTIPPPNTPIIPASSGNSFMDFLTGSMFGGIPNWALLGGAAFLFFGDHGGRK